MRQKPSDGAVTEKWYQSIGKGTRNPSLNLLKRLAEAMDSTLSIEFIPNKRTAH